MKRKIAWITLTVLLLVIALAVSPAVAQNPIPFGLNPEDFQRLQNALQETGRSSSFHIDVTGDLTLSSGNISQEISFSGEGVVLPGPSSALDVTLEGSNSNNASLPATYTREVTLASDTLYSRLTTGGVSDEWKDEPAGEVFKKLTRGALLLLDPEQLKATGLTDFLVFFDAITTMDLTPFVNIQRQNDDSNGNAVYTATLDFAKVFTSPDFTASLTQFANEGTQVGTSELTAAGLIVNLLFQGATFTADLYVGGEGHNHLHGIIAHLNLPIDASLISSDTPKINVAFNLQFNFGDYNQALSITTPDGVVINAQQSIVEAGPPLQPLQPPQPLQPIVINTDQLPPKALLSSEPLRLQLNGPFELTYSTDAPETVSIYIHSLPENSVPLDTTLEVVAPDGSQVGYNDDLTADSRDAGLENIRLSEAGEYIIRVNTFDLLQGGGVEVQLTASGRIETNGNNQLLLDAGGRLTGNGPANFTFSGSAGQVVNITVQAIDPRAPDMDLTLKLFAPDGGQIASDDDSGAANGLGETDPALISFELPDTGDYRLEVSAWFDTPGDIAVRVEPG